MTKTLQKSRRSFIKQIGAGGLAAACPVSLSGRDAYMPGQETGKMIPGSDAHTYNGFYQKDHLSRVAFPIGGIGAGMFCLEGTGALSHMSIYHRPEVFNAPAIFAAIAVKGTNPVAKVIEGPVPEWKIFGQRGAANGASGSTYGLPRFRSARFLARFPFATIDLADKEIPLKTTLTGWSPFIPNDEDHSSMPVGALEYTFKNTATKTVEAVFSFNSRNFVARNEQQGTIKKTAGGFILSAAGKNQQPELRADFAIYTDDPSATTERGWFRGRGFDPLTMAWGAIARGDTADTGPAADDIPGASLLVPLKLAPGATKTIRVLMAWYVPDTAMHFGAKQAEPDKDCDAGNCCNAIDFGLEQKEKKELPNYKPWYSSFFKNIEEVTEYWRSHYTALRKDSALFRDSFYSSTLPPEVMEAVAANLTILKTPTVQRQYDGRFWAWEGCSDDNGCCHGSCTHVWNYAQAIPHLFPRLERSLRNTEFCESQDNKGHQTFRSNLPISNATHTFHAAADGQLGGIMKVHREWRISNDGAWLRKIYPLVKKSIDYCIDTWDPKEKGVVEEPHHNTYDIEFWGPDGMCTSFYLGALQAMILMGKHLRENVSRYEALLQKGQQYMQTTLYDGEYFIQQIEWNGLKARSPLEDPAAKSSYSSEAFELLKKEGPKYQYGKGCLSDGVLGDWIARMCGMEGILDPEKVTSHLRSVHQYNFKKNLEDHVNPQRPTYAMGNEGGLLLCSWPKGAKLSLPFIYSNEVWTGIEYQVAAHLMLMGQVQQGLQIVKTCRDRYDGRIRNPFNEYECGHWYARAMSSYGMLQGLTGLRYDAVEKTLYIDSKVGDFTCFLSTATGYGTVTYKNKKAAVKVVRGKIEVDKTVIAQA
ncbi:GH116 family glycosyl hydrolase [Niabella aurantiaca]|uniref:GH116 family glycosyl hydrolase n=1 Tax=Niabella aurantiaca TaxID=379900 RepID=UPI000592C583|nr:GH116 family glycosyl hydrolase [Niabella aurantiaca]